MDFSNGELTVMEMLWKGDCLDENGEIQALELSKLLNEQYGFDKTSCNKFFGRLLEKGGNNKAVSEVHHKAAYFKRGRT